MIPNYESLTVEFKSDRKRMTVTELFRALVCLANTDCDLAFPAKDLGHNGPPFPFSPERLAQLRAEINAYYARLYGHTRNELRYILDPADVMGDDYPSETFRVLKNGELREFGEYRTQRLVLEAWDAVSWH